MRGIQRWTGPDEMLAKGVYMDWLLRVALHEESFSFDLFDFKWARFS